ncbi:hypothetical protein [Haladaptatus sp. NG-SE-30]
MSKRTSAEDNSAEGNDSVTNSGDGTTTVSGLAGNGYGDSYLVDGTFTSMTLDESKWTLRYGGKEVTVADLTGESDSPSKTIVIDGESASKLRE